MGGSSKKVTVGYKYYVGMHMVLCHGPIDQITHIRVDKKLAWEGLGTGGAITINKPNLFGGDKKQGGISGTVDIETGALDQGVNNYLQNKIGRSGVDSGSSEPGGIFGIAYLIIQLLIDLGVWDGEGDVPEYVINIPAFRGVAGVVLRQVYMGMNPYLKPWEFRTQRIHTTSDGATQWYDVKSQIGALLVMGPTSLYFALDRSVSMIENTGSNGETRLVNMKTAVLAALDYFGEIIALGTVERLDIMIVAFDNSRISITRRDIDSADITTLKSWVSAISATGSTSFVQAVTDAPTFFSVSPSNHDRVSFFITDGQPNPDDSDAAATTLLGILDIQAYSINIDQPDTQWSVKLDNTPLDGVPNLESGDPTALTNIIFGALSGQLDMNPAHIIRECLTDPDWGMGYPVANIDDASFTAAADTLYSEGFGLSLLWDKQMEIEEFITLIIQHIDAALCLDRTTGLFTLKLIRNDYVEDDLITLGDADIISVEGYSRPTMDELVNEVVVNFNHGETGDTASVTAQETALIQMQGGVVPTTIQYPGITNYALASRVAQRDLMVLSSPLLKGNINAIRKAADLNIGGVFKFEWSDFHSGYVVMRITGMSFGDGKDNQISITCIQDIFSLPIEAMTTTPEIEWTNPSQEPSPTDYDIVVEAPYFELVQRYGDIVVDQHLDIAPDLGYFLATAIRPAYAVNAKLAVDSGAGYEDAQDIDFCPSAVLTANIDRMATEIPIGSGIDLDLIVVGSHAQLGTELIRIDTITSTLLTVGRGILDTVPKDHSIGEMLFAWDYYAEGDETEYADGESIDVKIIPVSSAGEVDISQAAANTLVFDQRAIRPFPAGKLTVNTEYFPTAIVGTLVLSWAHRDRLQQTGGILDDFTDGDIGPETNTTYTLRIYDAVTDDLLRMETGITVTTYTYLDADEITDGGPFQGLRFELETERDSYDSIQYHDVTVYRYGYGYGYGYSYGGVVEP